MKLACLLLLSVVLAVNASIWSDCSTADDRTRATIQSITFSPDEPKKGDDLTIEAKFTLKENITGGKLEVDAKAPLGITYKHTFDLCETLKEVNLKCPLPATAEDITVKTKIPELAPRGEYEASGRAFDQNGKEIACLMAKYKLE